LDVCFKQVPAIIVAAAGNENVDACDMVPSFFDSVITVGGTNIEDKLFHFGENQGSNYGSCVDILAPGQDIVSATHENNKGEKTLTGTSMAAGYVSGIVAIYMQNFTDHHPTACEMKKLLQRTAIQRKTNAMEKYTADLLVYTSCDCCPVVPGLVKGKSSNITSPCFPYLINIQPIVPPAIRNFINETFKTDTLTLVGVAVSAGVVGVFAILVETIVRSRRNARRVMEETSRLCVPELSPSHENTSPRHHEVWPGSHSQKFFHKTPSNSSRASPPTIAFNISPKP
jgi:subtilisin family serine protease